MFRKSMSIAAPVLLCAVLFALFVVEPALAGPASDTSNPGGDISTNVGDWIKSWGQAILLGVAALVGIPALARRDLGQGMVIVLLTILIGGFIYADGAVRGVMKTTWEQIAGTSAEPDTSTCHVTVPEAC